ncbi:MAG: FeoB-associated Cys-rich membrane protein [Syntrophobacteraceae bacterium]
MLQSIIVGVLLIGSAAYVVRHFVKINRSGGDCGCGCSGGCSSTSCGCANHHDSVSVSLDQPKDKRLTTS